MFFQQCSESELFGCGYWMSCWSGSCSLFTWPTVIFPAKWCRFDRFISAMLVFRPHFLKQQIPLLSSPHLLNGNDLGSLLCFLVILELGEDVPVHGVLVGPGTPPPLPPQIDVCKYHFRYYIDCEWTFIFQLQRGQRNLRRERERERAFPHYPSYKWWRHKAASRYIMSLHKLF